MLKLCKSRFLSERHLVLLQTILEKTIMEMSNFNLKLTEGVLLKLFYLIM
jgi:hypothetical protein